MAKRKNSIEVSEESAATVGYEAQLWQMADELLPKLISGEIRIKDAEKFVERAL